MFWVALISLVLGRITASSVSRSSSLFVEEKDFSFVLVADPSYAKVYCDYNCTCVMGSPKRALSDLGETDIAVDEKSIVIRSFFRRSM